MSETHAGPAVTFEPTLVHRGKLDVYPVLGFALGFALGGGNVTFGEGTETNLGNFPLAEPEFGFGVRVGSWSLDAVFEISLAHFSNEDLGSPTPRLEKPAGITFAAGWSLPR